MSGKTVRNLLVAAILLGFCGYIVRLFARGDINLYIHPRYTWFAVATSCIAFIILLLGAALQLKKRSRAEVGSFNFLDKLVVAILLLAYFLPAQALSTEAIGRKSLNVPDYDATASKYSKVCPNEKPESVELWVYQISKYSIDCFKGQAISLTGFVFDSQQKPLPDQMYYLGRVFVSCCVIDSRPYALPIKVGKFQKYPKDTWLRVDGTLEVERVNSQYQLVIEPNDVKQVPGPSQPYEFK